MKEVRNGLLGIDKTSEGYKLTGWTRRDMKTYQLNISEDEYLILDMCFDSNEDWLEYLAANATNSLFN